jgi:serine/threonine protein kinase
MAGLEGKTLDHYTLERLIGRGGMADVYEGYDSFFHRRVAVKVFKREDEELLQRFIREANLMASLSNEHLVPIYGSGQTNIDGFTQYYIVMPFMDGGTLRARIRRSPLTLTEVCQYLSQIGEALDYIHSQGIVHRDIKSSNVLLDAAGHCYLSDFGIARLTTDITRLTSTGDVLGTVDYVAPELFEADRKADALSDLYSLGVLLFEMVTGRLPFYAENQIAVVTMHVNKRPPSPRVLNSNVSPQVERVMLKALEKKPVQRYQSATELAEAFCRAVTAGNKNGIFERKAEPFTPFIGANRAEPPLVLRAPPMPALQEAPPVSPVPNWVNRPLESSSLARAQRRPKPANPARRRAVVVSILAVLCLCIVAIPVFILYANSGNNPGVTPTAQTTTNSGTQVAGTTPSPTPNLTATAQAVATATAVAQQHATATAIARTTATAQAQARATAGVLQTATAGTPAYVDPLTDPNNPKTQAAQWDQDSHCTFAQDGYHVTEGVNLVNLHGCRESANQYSDAAISVNVRIHSGHSGGLFFRVSLDALGNYNGGYLFEIDSAGNYKISAFNNSPQPIQDWTFTSALKKGFSVKNTLQVIARGSKLLFYANGIFLLAFTDSTYSSGLVAFLATTKGEDADIVYTNLKVYPST